DEEVVEALYEALETRVLPLFWERGPDGLPHRWIDKMLAAGSGVARLFSSDRMLTEYLEEAYVPGAARRRDLKANNRERLKRLVEWKRRIEAGWSAVRFAGVAASPDPSALQPGERYEAAATLDLGALSPSDVRVELFEGPLEEDGTMESGYTVPLALVSTAGSRASFRGEHSRPAHAGIGWAVRARPHHPDPAEPNETVRGPSPRSGLAAAGGRPLRGGRAARAARACCPARHRCRGPSAWGTSGPRPCGSSTGRPRRGSRSGRSCRSGLRAPATRPTARRPR